ncbi:MAG: VOC family protein [Candidatus Zixiibacteriota bacterium]|jgi:catechol 2,3-dioxygenase-like lactoylglutathione lyase family enzyme
MSEKAAPKINVRFVYNFCNDVSPVRDFYSNLLGMEESNYSEEMGWLVYRSEGFDLMFFRRENGAVAVEDWAMQPGGGTGNAEFTSWSVNVPEAEFAATVKRLLDAGVPVQGDDKVPDWRQGCYWGFTVMDPAGNTIEVYTSPKEKPANTTWPGE